VLLITGAPAVAPQLSRAKMVRSTTEQGSACADASERQCFRVGGS